ncbi:hypothetical protein TrVFT333_009667 [Trichoderma virens FT-333]|nr:hypothetical protein TrVFT333_009667 [Trichoderma virens FT-333]
MTTSFLCYEEWIKEPIDPKLDSYKRFCDGAGNQFFNCKCKTRSSNGSDSFTSVLHYWNLEESFIREYELVDGDGYYDDLPPRCALLTNPKEMIENSGINIINLQQPFFATGVTVGLDIYQDATVRGEEFGDIAVCSMPVLQLTESIDSTEEIKNIDEQAKEEKKRELSKTEQLQEASKAGSLMKVADLTKFPQRFQDQDALIQKIQSVYSV